MLRVLLASSDESLVKGVEQELQCECLIETCSDGQRALELLQVFDPDVLMIDTMLNETDAITVVRTARGSLRRIGILAVTIQRDSFTIERLLALNVDFILGKPCKLSAVVSHILEIGFYIQNPSPEAWEPENEINSILLDLSFRMSLKHYDAVKEAVLARYYAEEGVMMKDIYYEVMKLCGGTSQQKEKAVRDGIKAAVKRGDLRVWHMYFPVGRDGQWRYPTNEEFVARIAGCLRNRVRLKLPYENKTKKAM